jgi:two-component system CheB/CheR fusion protein
MPRRKGSSSKSPGGRKRAVSIADKAGAATTQMDSARPVGTDGQATVVGVGASAGGLEAFSQLLQALPADLGMAIVFVQHLAPQHESALPTLLANVSALPVISASEGMRVEAGHVYVIPPNVRLEIKAGDLHLSTRPSDASQYTPIDFFLRSLADSAQRSIAVILSGTASDGAAGIKAVKAADGITIAQLPETAKYDGMPRAAIATGCVDLVLAPADIAAQLVAIARHGDLPDVSAASGPSAQETPSIPEEQLQELFGQLRAVSGIDFSQYKLPTIVRRLQRRMGLHKIARVGGYLRFLREHPAETQELQQDILIHFTRFFREPESFEALRERVFPKLLENRVGETPIRIWVCGCATGEEAYSVAIALFEFLGEDSPGIPIQIFATDVSDDAIQKARSGTYPEEIRADVSAERLRRFFVKTDHHYQVGKRVRDVCIFAQQDITRDPPFSKLDLVLCRNVLIYMTAPLQRRIMAVFHYALQTDGFLVLGHAETVGAHADLFRILDKRHRIYTRKSGKLAPDLGRMPEFAMPSIPARPRRVPLPSRSDGATMQSEADRIVMERYAPAGAVVDAEFQIVEFRGQTGAYLQPAEGEASLSILKMAREGLLYELRTALHAARKRNARVRRERLGVEDGASHREVNLEVIPLGTAERRHFLVLFEEAQVGEQRAGDEGKTKRPGRKAGSSGGRQRVARLEQELAASREYLESIIQELEGANEELQSANEEILSSNEELQSTNEELDTAKEELQSTNEELNTLNEELHGRNEELSLSNSDLVNLLGSVEIAIVIVTSDLRIRRFTPMAERILNLRGGDVGRPLQHIKPNIDCPELEDLARDSIDHVVTQEREVRDRDGKWYSLRFRPYKNLENRIDGAVLTLFDIDVAKRYEAEIRSARDTSQALVEALREPVLLLDRALRVRTVNGAFCTEFGARRQDLENQPFFESVAQGWDSDGLRAALDALASGERVDGFELSVPGRGGGESRRIRVGARSIAGVGDAASAILLLIDDAPDEAAAPGHTKD